MHHSYQRGEDGVGSLAKRPAQRQTLVITEETLGQPLHQHTGRGGEGELSLMYCIMLIKYHNNNYCNPYILSTAVLSDSIIYMYMEC